MDIYFFIGTKIIKFVIFSIIYNKFEVEIEYVNEHITLAKKKLITNKINKLDYNGLTYLD